MDIKSLLANIPVLKGMNSVVHWATYVAMAPFVMVLLGQAPQPSSWTQITYLGLHAVTFLVGAWILLQRDHHSPKEIAKAASAVASAKKE